jgi:AcrR family transcriptional regulator
MDDTKTRLLNAAGRVFAAKGYEAGTVREICRLAQVNNIAAVNYYFRDKERLYIESVKYAATRRLERIQRPEWPPGTPPAEKLRRHIRAFVGALLESSDEPWQLELMMRELSRPSAACAEFVRDLARPNFEVILGILDEIVPAETPRERRHLLALSIIGQCIYHKVAGSVVSQLVGDREYRRFTPERLAEHIADFSLAALGLAPTHAEAP